MTAAPSGTVRRRVVVRGRVQGVFFRDSTRRAARAAGVAGWVRNCRDGSVEVVLEGSEADVATMVGFCRQGPAGARVSDCQVFEEPPEGLRGFVITR